MHLFQNHIVLICLLILNVNFKDYYTSLKVNHSVQLLMTTNHSITTISNYQVLVVTPILLINLKTFGSEP